MVPLHAAVATRFEFTPLHPYRSPLCHGLRSVHAYFNVMLQLALRVLALYKNDTKVRVGLYTWLVLCHITLWVMVGISLSRLSSMYNCTITCRKEYLWSHLLHRPENIIYLPFSNTCYAPPEPIIGGVYIPPVSTFSCRDSINMLLLIRSRSNIRLTVPFMISSNK